MESSKAIEIFKSHYEQWLNNPLGMKTGYDYEKTYSEMMKTVEQEVLQSSVGEVPTNPNVKKTSNELRKNNYFKESSFIP